MRDEGGTPLLFTSAVDPATNLPFGMLGAVEERSTCSRDLLIKTSGLLQKHRAQLDARRHLQLTAQPPPDQPLIYLHAQAQDLPAWQEARAKLEPRSIVCPDSLPTPVADDVLLYRQREARLAEYALCDGLVLLHARNDQSFKIEVMAAYKDRQRLYQKTRSSIPWAIVDKVGTEPTIATTFRIPTVSVADPAWPDRLLQALGLAGKDAGSQP